MASHWTNECVATLRRIWETHSIVKIAEAINQEHSATFTRAAVVGKLHRLGLYKLGTGIKPEVTKPWFHPHTLPDDQLKRPRRKPGPAKNQAPKSDFVPFVPRIVETRPLNILFEELTDSVCKYECTDAKAPSDFRFCGHDAVPGKSYCQKHYALTHLQPTPRKDAYYRGRAA